MIYFFVGFLHLFFSTVIVENYKEKTCFLLQVFIEKLGIFIVFKMALRNDVVSNVTSDPSGYYINIKLPIYLHNYLNI